MENLPGRGCAVNGGHGLRVRVAFGLPSLCAQTKATNKWDKLQGAHSAQTFIFQRIAFAEN